MVILESTYVLTAFCVGNKTSLVPKAVAVDLFAVFSLVPSAVVARVTSVAKLVVKVASAAALTPASVVTAAVNNWLQRLSGRCDRCASLQ